MYKPPKLVSHKKPSVKSRRLQIYAPGGLYLEIALKYKGKQSKNGKFPFNYRASPIDFPP